MATWTGSAKQVGVGMSMITAGRALSSAQSFCPAEEVILAEERTTEEERNHIMEARRRVANKRKKMKLTGKSKSCSDEDADEDDAEEGIMQLTGAPAL